MADGIDPIKKELLRSRKKANCRATDSTEHGKWIGVYKILFPDDDPSSIPSPCKASYNYVWIHCRQYADVHRL